MTGLMTQIAQMRVSPAAEGREREVHQVFISLISLVSLLT